MEQEEEANNTQAHIFFLFQSIAEKYFKIEILERHLPFLLLQCGHLVTNLKGWTMSIMEIIQNLVSKSDFHISSKNPL